MTTNKTYGESRLRSILQQLPYTEFICYDEPRIDNTDKSRYPDFVIIWKSRGVIAIEVKDWKRINYKDLYQDHIEIIQPNGEILTKENPAITAKRYSDNLISLFEKRRELLEKYYGSEKLRFPCEGIVILTHIDTNLIKHFEENGIFPKNKVFSGNILANKDEFIRALSNIPWIWKMQIPISDDIVKVINHTLKLTAININKCIGNGEGSKVGSINSKQEEIIFRPLPIKDSGFSIDLIRGCVGSGKTLVLTKRADLLSKIRPDLKILVTAFNLDLTKDIREQIQNPKVEVLAFYDICKKILGDQWPQVEQYRDEWGPATIKGWVRNNEELIIEQGLTIEYVAQEIARRKDINLDTDFKYFEDLKLRNEPISMDQQQTICCMYDLYREYQESMKQNNQTHFDYEDIPDLVLNVINKNNLKRSYDVIMIDEAQDWAPKWIKIIKLLLKPGGYLFICDDPAQSLWRFFNWEQKGIHNYNKYILELPERTTQQIMEFAQSLLEINGNLFYDQDMDIIYPVKTTHLKTGIKPQIYCLSNEEDRINLIINKISYLLSKGVFGEQIGILCPNHNETKSWKELEIVKTNRVYVGHFNLMKGLEFNTVFIPQLDKAFSKEGDLDITSNVSVLRRLFVAITRARENLFITFSKKPPEILEPLLVYTDENYL